MCEPRSSSTSQAVAAKRAMPIVHLQHGYRGVYTSTRPKARCDVREVKSTPHMIDGDGAALLLNVLVLIKEGSQLIV